MKASVHDQVLALAGIYQAVKLVQQTARGERRDATATRTSLHSVMVTDPPSALEVYGSVAALMPGLETLADQLSNDSRHRDLELTGYVITLMHIERKLMRQPEMINTLSKGVENIKAEINAPEAADGDVAPLLAGLYSNTISNIQPRVMVKGDADVLRSSDSQRMVRALLLAAVRSVVLWRQCGGSRLRLIFQRRKILEGCRVLRTGARQT